uniref:NADH dehydrogenase [ubiquinone] 1 alpha subcomplex subunit 1 n=1 Tax=Pygocentrus nattereri TaxID=42514 RepID=A0A3B4CVS8_PYGNA
MWYEILPGFAIMTACLIIPGVATAEIQKYTNGGKEKRIARAPYQWYLMQRDKRLSGAGVHYKSKVMISVLFYYISCISFSNWYMF